MPLTRLNVRWASQKIFQKYKSGRCSTGAQKRKQRSKIRRWEAGMMKEPSPTSTRIPLTRAVSVAGRSGGGERTEPLEGLTTCTQSRDARGGWRVSTPCQSGRQASITRGRTQSKLLVVSETSCARQAKRNPSPQRATGERGEGGRRDMRRNDAANTQPNTRGSGARKEAACR